MSSSHERKCAVKNALLTQLPLETYVGQNILNEGKHKFGGKLNIWYCKKKI